MPTCKRKPTQHKATQWNNHGDHSLVYGNGEQGAKWSFTNDKCSKCGKTSDEHGYLITSRHGGKIICPGDWIVDKDGGLQAYSDKEFHEKYEVELV